MLDSQTLSAIAYLQGQVEDLQRQKVVVEAQLMDAMASKSQLVNQMGLVRAAFEDRQTGAFQELQLLRISYSELKMQHEQCLATSRRLTQQHSSAMQRCQQLERSIKSSELENTDLLFRVTDTKRALEGSMQQVTSLSSDLQRLQQALLSSACMPSPAPNSFASSFPQSSLRTASSLSNDHSSSSSSNPDSDSAPPSLCDGDQQAFDTGSGSPFSPQPQPQQSCPAASPNVARLEAILLALIGPSLTSSLLDGAEMDPLDVVQAVKDCASRLHGAPAQPPGSPPSSASSDPAGTTRTVFVTKLARHVTDDMLGRVFSAFGTVERSEMARRGHGSANRNFAWVRFARAEDAEAALKFFSSGEPHAARFGELLGRSSGERVVVKRTQRELGPHGGIEPPPPSSSSPHAGATPRFDAVPSSTTSNGGYVQAAVTGMAPTIIPATASSLGPPMDGSGMQQQQHAMGRGYDGYMMCLAEGNGWPASLPAFSPADASDLLSSLGAINMSYASAFPPSAPASGAPNLQPLMLQGIDTTWLNHNMAAGPLSPATSMAAQYLCVPTPSSLSLASDQMLLQPQMPSQMFAARPSLPLQQQQRPTLHLPSSLAPGPFQQRLPAPTAGSPPSPSLSTGRVPCAFGGVLSNRFPPAPTSLPMFMMPQPRPNLHLAPTSGPAACN